MGNISICTSVPLLTTKGEHSDVSKKTPTMSMLDEKYPRKHGYGSSLMGQPQMQFAEEVLECTSSSRMDNGRQKQSQRVFTCTNYKAEEQAMIHAASTLKTTEADTQIVLLTDVMSVLQALSAEKLPRLQEALQNIRCTRLILQWIPSYCGIYGNEEADKLAKMGAEDEQKEDSVSPTEVKTIIKSLHKPPQAKDSYHYLSRKEQVIIFRLRTGHNRLNNHMSKRFRLVPSPLCSCGESNQNTEHIVQDCRDLGLLREETWPMPTSMREAVRAGGRPADDCYFHFENHSPSVTAFEKKKISPSRSSLPPGRPFLS